MTEEETNSGQGTNAGDDAGRVGGDGDGLGVGDGIDSGTTGRADGIGEPASGPDGNTFAADGGDGGKRRGRGRPRGSRNRRGSARGSAGAGNTGGDSDGGSRGGDIGGGPGNAGPDAGAGDGGDPATDAEAAAARFVSSQTRRDSVTIEAPKGEPEPGLFAAAAGASGRKRKPKKGDIDARDVERAVIALFGLVAMARGPHWAVADRDEVAAWSEEAAALLGKIPTRVAAAALNASAALTVAVGLGTMVYRRVQIDAEIQRRVQAQLAAERRAAAAAKPSGVPTAAGNQPAASQMAEPRAGNVRDLFPELFEV